jgi:hypothetical protein
VPGLGFIFFGGEGLSAASGVFWLIRTREPSSEIRIFSIGGIYNRSTNVSNAMRQWLDNRVIHRPPPAPQNGFFPDPLAPDPVIYHIRDVTPGMTEQDKKEIYSVTSYPTKDLSDQIAGVPPDKDFSNAKPTNQVAANTFLTFVESYLRPLTEEDMAFLRERVSMEMLICNKLLTRTGRSHYTVPCCPSRQKTLLRDLVRRGWRDEHRSFCGQTSCQSSTRKHRDHHGRQRIYRSSFRRTIGKSTAIVAEVRA